MIAVVAGDAALVDVEPDAPVRGDARAEVRDAYRDVIDALENGRAFLRDSRASCHVAQRTYRERRE